jgi:hypothetical protein
MTYSEIKEMHRLQDRQDNYTLFGRNLHPSDMDRLDKLERSHVKTLKLNS